MSMSMVQIRELQSVPRARDLRGIGQPPPLLAARAADEDRPLLSTLGGKVFAALFAYGTIKALGWLDR